MTNGSCAQRTARNCGEKLPSSLQSIRTSEPFRSGESSSSHLVKPSLRAPDGHVRVVLIAKHRCVLSTTKRLPICLLSFSTRFPAAFSSLPALSWDRWVVIKAAADVF